MLSDKLVKYPDAAQIDVEHMVPLIHGHIFSHCTVADPGDYRKYFDLP
jgi:hypothetical protein